MNQVAVSVAGLSKRYGETIALHDISFEIDRGELFGFIGPDGAGKTTLLRILTSLIIPDSGKAVVEGYNVVKDYRKIRSICGYMPGRFSLYYDLTVEENLTFFATIFGTTVRENYDQIKEIYRLIEPFKSRKAGKLSGGMKQKLALSCALIHRPVILFLDEPTTGVDAVSRLEFWDMLKRLKQNGITILVSTPYMDEASLCDRVALIQDGRIMRISSPGEIVRDYPYPLFSVKAKDIYRLLGVLRDYEGVHSVHAFGQLVHLSFIEKYINLDALRDYLHQKEFHGIEIHPIPAAIEDCFMELMQGYKDQIVATNNI